jgi:putative hydrolase of the HAD superfamily
MPKRTMIRTFWFDLGNVLLFFDFTPAYRYLARSSPLGVREIRSYFHRRPRLEADVDEGRIGARQLHRKLVRDLRLEGVSYPRFRRTWNAIFKANPPVIRLLRRLRAKGYRLILISNTNRLHYDYVSRKYPFLRLFHRHVLSFRTGVRKPKRRIYREALRHSRAEPRQIVYIDDRRDLVDRAGLDHGIHTHAFRTVAALRRDLRRLGVRVP